MNKKIITLGCLLALQTGCATFEQPDLGTELASFEFRCQANTVKVCEVGSLKGCACYTIAAAY